MIPCSGSGRGPLLIREAARSLWKECHARQQGFPETLAKSLNGPVAGTRVSYLGKGQHSDLEGIWGALVTLCCIMEGEQKPGSKWGPKSFSLWSLPSPLSLSCLVQLVVITESVTLSQLHKLETLNLSSHVHIPSVTKSQINLFCSLKFVCNSTFNPTCIL